MSNIGNKFSVRALIQYMKLYGHIMKACLAVVLTATPCVLHAQWFGSSTESINTLRTVVNNDWELPAVITLDSDDRIEFSFDEMSHEYHRFTYHIQHCDAAWKPSTGILESDYMDGFNGETIDVWLNSVNTTFYFTQYRLVLPN